MRDISKNIEETQAVNLSQSNFFKYMVKEPESYEIKKVLDSPYIRKHKNFLEILNIHPNQAD